MFKFFKEKLKKTVSLFSRKVEEQGREETAEEAKPGAIDELLKEEPELQREEKPLPEEGASQQEYEEVSKMFEDVKEESPAAEEPAEKIDLLAGQNLLPEETSGEVKEENAEPGEKEEEPQQAIDDDFILKPEDLSQKKEEPSEETPDFDEVLKEGMPMGEEQQEPEQEGKPEQYTEEAWEIREVEKEPEALQEEKQEEPSELKELEKKAFEAEKPAEIEAEEVPAAKAPEKAGKKGFFAKLKEKFAKLKKKKKMRKKGSLKSKGRKG